MFWSDARFSALQDDAQTNGAVDSRDGLMDLIGFVDHTLTPLSTREHRCGKFVCGEAKRTETRRPSDHVEHGRGKPAPFQRTF